jgi:hypothetical protein
MRRVTRRCKLVAVHPLARRHRALRASLYTAHLLSGATALFAPRSVNPPSPPPSPLARRPTVAALLLRLSLPIPLLGSAYLCLYFSGTSPFFGPPAAIGSSTEKVTRLCLARHRNFGRIVLAQVRSEGGCERTRLWKANGQASRRAGGQDCLDHDGAGPRMVEAAAAAAAASPLPPRGWCPLGPWPHLAVAAPLRRRRSAGARDGSAARNRGSGAWLAAWSRGSGPWLAARSRTLLGSQEWVLQPGGVLPRPPLGAGGRAERCGASTQTESTPRVSGGLGPGPARPGPVGCASSRA